MSSMPSSKLSSSSILPPSSGDLLSSLDSEEATLPVGDFFPPEEV